MSRHDTNKQRIRNQFLSVATDLILEKGYDAVSVAEICRVADYGRSTFYVYFEDKEALVWEILKHNLAIMDVEILTAIDGLASPTREWVAWRMIFASVPPQRDFYLKLDGDLSRRLRQWQKEQLIMTFERQLHDGVYSLLLDVPPEIGARFITGAIIEILNHWLVHPDLGDGDTLARHFFRLVFREEPPES
ncbi:MAG: TetR/AcrR family transcriptional regulator [Chloroflexota bacterium]